ncbi:MAG: hypothetical protein HOQ05_02705 [Corynebacteriales bacterium]|nr:hypothetical protein [Mycobacteriales bacterium]
MEFRERNPENVARDEAAAEMLARLQAMENRGEMGTAEWRQLREEVIDHSRGFAMWLVEHRIIAPELSRQSNQYHQERKDFRQAAELGVLVAIGNFISPDRRGDEPFSRYLSNAILEEARGFRKEVWDKNIPEGGQEAAKHVRRAIYPLVREKGGTITLDELVEKLRQRDSSWHADKVKEILGWLPEHYSQQVVRERVNSTSSRDRFGTLRNHRGGISSRDQAAVMKWLATLSERDKAILMLRFQEPGEGRQAQVARIADTYDLRPLGVERIAGRLLRELQEAHPEIEVRGLRPRKESRQATAAVAAAAERLDQPATRLEEQEPELAESKHETTPHEPSLETEDTRGKTESLPPEARTETTPVVSLQDFPPPPRFPPRPAMPPPPPTDAPLHVVAPLTARTIPQDQLLSGSRFQKAMRRILFWKNRSPRR